MQALATIADYELLIGPVATADEPKITFLEMVATSVVVTHAPGLLPWASGTPPVGADGITPLPVPEPAILVTCQTAANIEADPTGGGGKVQMERVGVTETSYAPGGDLDLLLPVAWRRLLKPWRPPVMASIRMSVPHPMEYGMGGWGGYWWVPPTDLGPPPDPPYYDGWGENENEWPWSAFPDTAPATSGFDVGFDEGF